MKKEWRKKHWNELKKLAGNWIAYDPNGDILFADKDIDIVFNKIRTMPVTQYVLHYIHPNDVEEYRPARFVPIRFKSLRQHIWQPFYDIVMQSGENSASLSMLVDSGADFSLIGYKLGKNLGFERTRGEVIGEGEGVGSVVQYVLRYVKFIIDGHEFDAKVAWLLDEEYDELLLGRDTVFDLFDIEFKQADETIIFKWRGDVA
jgi:hypothetical protein